MDSSRQSHLIGAADFAGYRGDMSAELFWNEMRQIKGYRSLRVDPQCSLLHRFAFFKVHKTASSTVLGLIWQAELQLSGWARRVQDPNDPFSSPLILPYQLPRSEFVDFLRSPDVKRVAFVRNPFARLVSCYRHRVVGSAVPNPTKRALTGAAGVTDVSGLSFARFLNIVCGQAREQMESHYAPQVDVSLHAVVPLTFVGRFERLADGLLGVQRHLFGREVVPVRDWSDKRLGPMETRGANFDWSAVSPELVGAVQERYVDDFEAFGYSIDPGEVL
jgi:hypothetical protein